MDDSENNKLIVRNVHALLPSVSKQISITNKLLPKIDDLEKWWEELEPEWKKIFLRELKTKPDVVTLEIIQRMRNLTYLSCWGEGIENLEPVSKLTNLKYLDCVYTGITTIEPIRNLNKLKELECDFTNITTLEPIGNLTNLEYLSCEGTGITTVSPLKYMRNLKEFVCMDTKVSDAEIKKFKNERPEVKVYF